MQVMNSWVNATVDTGWRSGSLAGRILAGGWSAHVATIQIRIVHFFKMSFHRKQNFDSSVFTLFEKPVRQQLRQDLPCQLRLRTGIHHGAEPMTSLRLLPAIQPNSFPAQSERERCSQLLPDKPLPEAARGVQPKSVPQEHPKPVRQTSSHNLLTLSWISEAVSLLSAANSPAPQTGSPAHLLALNKNPLVVVAF